MEIAYFLVGFAFGYGAKWALPSLLKLIAKEPTLAEKHREPPKKP